MSETSPGDDVAATMDKDAADMEHGLDRLEDHISEAQKAAERRRADLDPDSTVAGDWEDTKGTAGQGEDPKGAVDEDKPSTPPPGSATPGDAGGGDD